MSAALDLLAMLVNQNFNHWNQQQQPYQYSWLNDEGWGMYFGPCTDVLGMAIALVADRKSCGLKLPGEELDPNRFGTYVNSEVGPPLYRTHGHWVRTTSTSEKPQVVPLAYMDWVLPYEWLHPMQYPALDPLRVAPGVQPLPNPRPLPVRALPGLRPRPEALPTPEGSSADYGPSLGPAAGPGSRNPPGTAITPDGGVRPTDPHRYVPPPRGTKEKKGKGGKGLNAAARALAGASLGGKIIDAFYKALPANKQIARQNGDRPPTPFQKLEAIAKAWNGMGGDYFAKALMAAAQAALAQKAVGGLQGKGSNAYNRARRNLGYKGGPGTGGNIAPSF